MKTPDYLSYDRYKRKKASNPKRRLALFIGTFIISVMVFFTLAMAIAPDVDVTIGDEVELEEKSIGLGVKQFVDSRLRSIDLDDMGKLSVSQNEESLNKKTDSEISDESYDDEVLELPVQKSEKKQIANEEPAVMPAYEAPRPDKTEIIAQTETPKTSYKVYVGKYSTSTQAKVAKDILMDSGMEISPFVKSLNGTYTLQVGSFADKAGAEQLSKELSKNGFPARIVQE